MNTGLQDKILKLLGNGMSPAITAAAAGTSESYVSQLLSNSEFATAVSELRLEALARSTELDNKWNSVEEKLLDKLQDVLPYLVKPNEIIRAAALANAAKRRGASAPESLTVNQQVVILNMPTPLVHRFTTDGNNQVVKTTQELLTLPSRQLDSLLTARKKEGETYVQLPEVTETARAAPEI